MSAKCPSKVLSPSQLYTNGVRCFFDAHRCTHGDGTNEGASRYREIALLEHDPPLYTLAPVVMIVVTDVAFMVHRHLLPAGHIVHCKIDHDDCSVLRIWGQDVPVCCVYPPEPAQFARYVVSQLYGCRCCDCAAIASSSLGSHADDTAGQVQAIRDYMGH